MWRQLDAAKVNVNVNENEKMKRRPTVKVHFPVQRQNHILMQNPVERCESPESFFLSASGATRQLDVTDYRRS